MNTYSEPYGLGKASWGRGPLESLKNVLELAMKHVAGHFREKQEFVQRPRGRKQDGDFSKEYYNSLAEAD